MKIKHYTFFTDSHKVFLKYFLNTFPFDPDIDLNIRYMPQECESGEFVSEGWNNTMKRKVQYILDSLKEMDDNDIFIHTDADIVFIKPYKKILLEELGDADLIFQSDIGTACMGVFACKVNDRTKSLFNKLYNDLSKHYHDQEGINHIIRNKDHHPDLKIRLFSYKFFNHGFLGKHYEEQNDDVIFPQDMVLLHANFTVGIERKVKLIQLALQRFNLK
jgi:hypothetical protein